MSSRFPRNSLTAVWVSTCPPISWEFEVLQKNTCQSHVLSSHNSFLPRCNVRQLVLYVSHSVTVLLTACHTVQPISDLIFENFQWDSAVPDISPRPDQLTVKHHRPPVCTVPARTQHVPGPWLTLHVFILTAIKSTLKTFFLPRSSHGRLSQTKDVSLNGGMLHLQSKIEQVNYNNYYNNNYNNILSVQDLLIAENTRILSRVASD